MDLMHDLSAYSDQFLNMVCVKLQEYKDTCSAAYRYSLPWGSGRSLGRAAVPLPPSALTHCGGESSSLSLSRGAVRMRPAPAVLETLHGLAKGS